MNISSQKTDFEETETLQSERDRLSREEKAAPNLSHRGLTIMLTCMCLIPIITILVLWQYLPAIYEGTLDADITSEGLPAFEFYATDYYERPPFEGGSITVKNMSDVEWTNINVQVNGHYQIYDRDPISAKGERVYLLPKFLNRTGARFSLQYNELNRVRVYARQPEGDRATFVKHFETYAKVQTEWWPVVILLSVFAFLLFIAAKVFSKLYEASRKEEALKSSSV